MDFSEILPIGTVCILKGAKKKVMIIGYKKNNKKLIDFNYIGCQFPEGITSKKGQLYFLYDQIGKIYFMGYNEKNYVNKKSKNIKQEHPTSDEKSDKNNETMNNDLKNHIEEKEIISNKNDSNEVFESIPTQ